MVYTEHYQEANLRLQLKYLIRGYIFVAALTSVNTVWIILLMLKAAS